MIEALKQTAETLGGATAVVILVCIIGLLAFVTTDEFIQLVRMTIQSRKDNKLFNQIEEFRRDFQ